MATVWTVKGGRRGQREERFLEHGLFGGGWEQLPSLADVSSRDELATLYGRSYPDVGKQTLSNYVGQLWSLLHRMQKDDLVVVRLKTTGTVAVGRISGPYEYRTDLGEDLTHTRPVTWIAIDVPPDAFDQDLLYSFGAFLTFGQVRRDEAEERVLQAIKERRRPDAAAGEVAPGVELEVPDIEALTREQVRGYISRNFAGHDLARLVAAVLKGQGFSSVHASPPGPDGGVDILAGSGPMGLDAPRLVAQVKTGQAGVDELRALRGVVENFRGDQGLLVAWGGFKGKVRAEAARSYFVARIWDAEDLLEALFSVYDRLSDDVRSELPLQRVWALVPPAE